MKSGTALGQLILERRKGLSLTQDALSKIVGVRASYIAYLEAGRRKPSIPVLKRLAEAIGVESQTLLVAAYPETETMVNSDASVAAPRSATQAWTELLTDRVLLARYRITRRELHALKQLSLLGYVLSPREFLAILMLIRGEPTRKGAQYRRETSPASVVGNRMRGRQRF